MVIDRILDHFSDKKLQKKRLNICSHCEHKRDKWLALFNEDSCAICKCSLKKKTAIRMTRCPLRKW